MKFINKNRFHIYIITSLIFHTLSILLFSAFATKDENSSELLNITLIEAKIELTDWSESSDTYKKMVLEIKKENQTENIVKKYIKEEKSNNNLVDANINDLYIENIVKYRNDLNSIQKNNDNLISDSESLTGKNIPGDYSGTSNNSRKNYTESTNKVKKKITKTADNNIKKQPEQIIEEKITEKKNISAALDNNSYKEPLYPEIARQSGWEGEVELGLEINEYGKIEKIMIKKSSGFKILDEAAIKAVKSWNYYPAYKDGKTVKDFLTQAVKFVLENKN